MKGSVLIVEDDRAMARALATGLREAGFDELTAIGGSDGLDRLRTNDVDVVLADYNMPGMNGLQFCRQVVENGTDVPVVLLTAFGSIDTAIAAIRAGAYDFIQKPVDIEGLALSLERAVQHHRLRSEVKRLRSLVARQGRVQEILGDSPATRELRERIESMAASDATVLISGETGSGKELAARAVHRLSARKERPFVTLSSGAVPEALLEHELFGVASAKDVQPRKGLFEQASGGTLFLDDVDALPLAVQAMLVRALQDRRVRPAGAVEDIPIDVRVIGATSRDLSQAVEDGRFRDDLFFRLHVLHLEVPPLRARGSDVLVLAQEFLRRSAAHTAKDVVNIGETAVERLLAYPWPGNVRELQNAIEHAVSLARYDRLNAPDLPARIRDHRGSHIIVASDNPDELVPLEEVEKRYILRVLEACGGNKRMAARILGLDRRTLYRKLEHY